MLYQTYASSLSEDFAIHLRPSRTPPTALVGSGSKGDSWNRQDTSLQARGQLTSVEVTLHLLSVRFARP
jgi:hypothetical protein